MKIIVVICVHNRIENIRKWLNAWQKCEQHGAQLVVVHNFYGNTFEQQKFKALCANVKYVGRSRYGFDIGALQDVCRERLPGFDNDWDLMLWCCDDTLPISKDFLKQFIAFRKDTGVTCMQISNEVTTHIRTTGFMVNKEVSRKLIFPADPVTTKEHCYQFEHRSANHFYAQVIAMGLKVKQVEGLWDSDHPNPAMKTDRLKEYNEAFNPLGKVVFICPVYDAFPQIISSLICQTHKKWELLLLHDGTNDLSKVIAGYNDKRIKYIKRPRAENWGHPLRAWALNEIKAGKYATDADYIVITNADNYYVPVFCERMLQGFTNGQVAVYCDKMVHSYVRWNIIPVQPRLGFIDCGGVVVRKDIAVETGWRDMSHSSDWTYFSDIIKKHGIGRWARVPGVLFVHN